MEETGALMKDPEARRLITTVPAASRPSGRYEVDPGNLTSVGFVRGRADAREANTS